MIRSKTSYIFIPLIILLFISCAGISPYYEEGSQKDKRTRAEKGFNPMGFEGDSDVVPSPLSAESDSLVSGLDRYKLRSDSIESPADTVKFVYRVQIFTSRFLQEAERVRDEATTKFEETVHMDFDAPYYKVRIGDFETMEEGERFLGQVRDLGYTDVWLVKVRLEE